MENANTQNSKCDILSNFHTLCMKGGAYYIIILAPGYVCRCNALMSLLTSNWMTRMHLQLTPNPVNNDAYADKQTAYIDILKFHHLFLLNVVTIIYL